jgi:diamine N-acetyltransferase
MPIQVRPARREDAEVLSQIGAATFALACPPSTPAEDLEGYIRSELSPQRFREHLESQSKAILAAEVDGTVAGYLMLCREQAPGIVRGNKPLEIRRLYVLPQFHGGAIGLLLMGHAVERAQVDRHDSLWLSVSKENRRGITFYRKAGFAVIGEQAFAVGSELHEDFIMVRRFLESA